LPLLEGGRTAGGPVRIGNLMLLAAALGDELWGGYKGSAPRAVTNNVDWDRLLVETRHSNWAVSRRVGAGGPGAGCGQLGLPTVHSAYSCY
jgi:hypothetical protein